MKCELFGAVFHFCEGTLHLVLNVHFSVLFFISVWEHYITCGMCMFSVLISLSVRKHYIPCGTVHFFSAVFSFCIGTLYLLWNVHFRFCFPFLCGNVHFLVLLGTIPDLCNVHLRCCLLFLCGNITSLVECTFGGLVVLQMVFRNCWLSVRSSSLLFRTGQYICRCH